MADKKISALTAATLPLAGTEVLPIVQSGSTVKVATDDLTVKNVRSNATSGLLQVAGPGAGTTRVMTTPNANFTAARTDAAQSFTGDQTLGTGNLVQGTAGKGVNFTANTAAAGMTSQLLNWYEEGTFTPTINSDGGGTGTYSQQKGFYTRIGNRVMFNIYIAWSAHTGSGKMYVGGIPFTASSTAGSYNAVALGEMDLNISANNVVCFDLGPSGTQIAVLQYPVGGGAVTQVTLDTNGYLILGGQYMV